MKRARSFSVFIRCFERCVSNRSVKKSSNFVLVVPYHRKLFMHEP